MKKKNGIYELVATTGYLLISAGFRLPGTGLINKWVEKIRLVKLIRELEINCVLDVGANQGQYANMLRRLGFKGHIFSFEPNPTDFLSLSDRFVGDPFWKGFNFALGSDNIKRVFNVTNYSVMSSFLKPTNVRIARTIEVDVKRLDSILDRLLESVRHPSIFLKMDTQGYDIEVMKGASHCLDPILALQSELSVDPLYENMPNYLDALRYYESLGFRLMDLFVVNRTQKGGILEYDCLMSRIQGTEKYRREQNPKVPV